MASKSNRGIETKNALASAFVALLREGKPLGKIRVKDLTDACGLDRQTFYYHFKSMSELGRFAYERELRQTFGAVNLNELGWRDRVLQLLAPLDEESELRRTIVPSLGEKPVREALSSALESELNLDLLPRLMEAGMTEEDARHRIHILTFMLEATLTSWLSGELEEDTATIVDDIEEMLRDYVNGVSLRLN